ncbi:4-(cytidine 5'-diphospho)-2-C-methyl-D-erythritol kinase [Chitinibacter bivalviorum]|uniref:4-diphosphocytidyl-2-C-methyl-D-erythritol kinase n=1 Tax=Chitinibacter bivalviorum TaxID=2739434 RepID=A0A7H9BJQ0_9NEIS|nr:4-(cytidine 5'-diphospho)-2-C-methyl-D-erythritol kinase [Chitinibacter bivalviorum]QLG88905.1 4-(cytidine 5'-diphospho)-2-C-methyl-D-erythritol kinase [Chitinibacter bivalviorum]
MSYTPLVDAEGFAAFPAPAKLNLFLHIVGRRADGYHLLESIFQLVDAHDTVWLRVRDDGQIVHHNPMPNVPAETDLTVRAAKLLQTATGVSYGVDIRVDKRLPMGGGMGGGSSDAATVLLALNRLWHVNWQRQALMDLGLQLGADVPFFIFGRNALVEGIGEIMTPIETEATDFVVLHPPVHVPTPAIFGDPELTRNTPSLKVSLLEGTADWRVLRNDLESVAVRKYPQIAQHIQWLSQYAPARMTGSGSCVFAAFVAKDVEKNTSQNQANAVIFGLPKEMSGFVTSSLQEHQLLGFASD